MLSKFSFLKQKKFFKAFTLIEIIIIVFILIIIGIVAYTQLEQRGPAKARDARRVSELNTLRDALQLYYIDHGRFPSSTDAETECYIGAQPGDPHYCPYLESELVPEYIKELPIDPLNEPDRGFVYIYESTSSGSGYTLRTNLETRAPFVISSAGGFAMPGGESGGGGGGPSLPTISFDPSSYSVNEDEGSVIITVTISSAPVSNPASVDISTSDGTATGGACGAGADYTSHPSTLTWNVGDSSSKTFTVTICDDGDYEGNEDFSVTLFNPQNANIGTNPATVIIVDNESPSPNNPPQANNDSYSTPQDTPLNVPPDGVLGNDSDPDGDPLTAVKDTDPSHGSLVLNSDGSFTYTPNPGYTGLDSFTYRAYDGRNYSLPATVEIDVTKQYVWSYSNSAIATVGVHYSDYSVSTSSKELIFTSQQPQRHAQCRIGYDRYLVAYLLDIGGGVYTGKAQVINVDTSTFPWALSTSSDAYEFAPDANYPALAKIDNAHYLLAYVEPATNDGYATVLEINPAGNIKEPGHRLKFTDDAYLPSLAQIDSKHYLVVYSGPGDDGYAAVLEIDSHWNISRVTSEYRFDPLHVGGTDVIKIDATHYLIVYKGTGNTGRSVVLEVKYSGGSWQITKAGPIYTFESGSLNGWAPYVAKIDTSHYLVVYQSGKGWSIVLEVKPDWSIQRKSKFQFESDLPDTPYVARTPVEPYHYLVTYFGGEWWFLRGLVLKVNPADWSISKAGPSSILGHIGRSPLLTSVTQ